MVPHVNTRMGKYSILCQVILIKAYGQRQALQSLTRERKMSVVHIPTSHIFATLIILLYQLGDNSVCLYSPFYE